MTCSVCLPTTPELQTIAADGRCPRCGTDYSSWERVKRDDRVNAYNARTRKLIPNGDAQRDRLVAARLSLRSNA